MGPIAVARCAFGGQVVLVFGSNFANFQESRIRQRKKRVEYWCNWISSTINSPYFDRFSSLVLIRTFSAMRRGGRFGIGADLCSQGPQHINKQLLHYSLRRITEI